MAAKARAKADAPPETFETLYARLEETARKLELGNVPLEESLTLYEEGAALVAKLRVILQGAELRIRTIQRQSEGDISLGNDDADEDVFEGDEDE